MQLMFKQRVFSWFDSYDIFDAAGNTVYSVCGKPAWGHKMEVYDAAGNPLATLKQQVLTFLPRFDILVGGNVLGSIKKEFTFFKPSFCVDCNGWRVEGNFWEWDYAILNAQDQVVARIEKQFFQWSDTYIIDVFDERDALMALMVVLAIDAVKCSQNG